MDLKSPVRIARSERVHRISEGIKQHAISDADILSLAVQSSARKRAKDNNGKFRETDNQENIEPANNREAKKFNREICNTAVKVNIPEAPVFPISPYMSKERQSVNHARRDNSEEDPSEHFTIVYDTIDSDIEQENHVYSNDLPEDQIFEGENESQECDLLGQLRQQMKMQILNILNNGTHEQLIALKGIAKVRATKIFTLRNAGLIFEDLSDLSSIGMNEKNIAKFMEANLGCLLCHSK